MQTCIIDRPPGNKSPVRVEYVSKEDLLQQSWSYSLNQWYTTKLRYYFDRACACERALIVLWQKATK